MKKETVKKETVKKETVKKESLLRKSLRKKAEKLQQPCEKAAAREEIKETVTVQFAGKSYSSEDLVKIEGRMEI